MKFALFGNNYQHRKSAHTATLLNVLRKHEAQIYVDSGYYDFLKGAGIDLAQCLLLDNETQFNIALSIGGDGTFLRTAARVGKTGIPILGINTGRLGFLSATSPNDIEETLDEVFAGKIEIEKRNTLEAKICGSSAPSLHALNEVAILKGNTSAMVEIEVDILGERLITYRADGLIVATPTGSTAYSLSNGGSIVVPGSNVMLLTAVAPHSLSTRPLIVPDNTVLTIKVSSRSNPPILAIDGHNHHLNNGSTLTITRGQHDIYIVHRQGQTFFNTLRTKLGF